MALTRGEWEDEVRPDLIRQFGECSIGDCPEGSWLAYNDGLAHIATRLARRSRPVVSVRELFRFAVARSLGLSRGAIEGTVVDLHTGEPVARETVVALQGAECRGRGETDLHGRFVIECLDPGQYELAMADFAVKSQSVVLEEAKDALGVVLRAFDGQGVAPCEIRCDTTGLPDGPLEPAEGMFIPIGTWDLTIRSSFDPNEKKGSGKEIEDPGRDGNKCMTAEEALQAPPAVYEASPGERIWYWIEFENVAGACPAFTVTITDDLDADKLDLDTLRFEGEVLDGVPSHGEEFVSAPGGYVDISRSAGAIAQWTLRSVFGDVRDCEAGWLPAGHGGHVVFSVQSKADLTPDPETEIVQGNTTIDFDGGKCVTRRIIHRVVHPRPPEAPEPWYPEDGARNVDPSSVIFSWSAVGATVYDVRIWPEEDPAAVLGETAINGPSLHVDRLDHGTSYLWEVVARNEGVSNPTEVSGGPWRFTTRLRLSRGDANADGDVNMSDASFLLNWLFLGGPRPRCRDAVDTNDDGGVDISDVIYLLKFLFLGRPPVDNSPPTCE
jgi:hypothetical protein